MHVVDNESMDDEKASAFPSFLTSPFVKTPDANSRDAMINKKLYHVEYTLKRPNCDSVIIRVYIGVVSIDMPFCTKLQIKNQKEAFAGAGTLLYFTSNFFNIFYNNPFTHVIFQEY